MIYLLHLCDAGSVLSHLMSFISIVFMSFISIVLLQVTDQSQSEEDPVSSPRQVEGSSLKEGSEWKQVHVWHGR